MFSKFDGFCAGSQRKIRPHSRHHRTHLDVAKCADWIVDLGPEGGEGGGEIVAVGTPEQVANNPRSYTGQFLATHLQTE